jgi:Protein-glutamine gamma-glutamyltransferase
MNLREFWAAEAAKLRDTSALLDTSGLNIPTLSSTSNMSLFQLNIILVSKRVFSNRVEFGSNGERNIKGFYDKRFWETAGAVNLKLKTGVKPSTAIDSIINNSSGNQTLDCAQYVEVVRLGATLMTDGDQLFDERFKNGLNLRSHGSTSVETEISYERPSVNTLDTKQYFAINNNPEKVVYDSEEQLLTAAPIGSRVSVTNFNIEDTLKPDSDANVQMKTFALQIRKKGWENENMIKIGKNEYAAFGIGEKVNLTAIKQCLFKIHIDVFKTPIKDQANILNKIAVSQIEIFKRN